jgi:AraC-like DNA-binding protein
MQIVTQIKAEQVLLTNSMPEFLRSSGSGSGRCTDAIWRPIAGCDVVVWTSASRSAVRICGPLSIRAIWGGSERCTVGRRTFCVDEDNYLVINGGREYLACPERCDTGESLTIFFSDAAQRTCAVGCAGDGVLRPGASNELFAEHLRPHGDAVSQYLQRIREARQRGITDNSWYSKQVRMLYAQLVVSNDELQCKSAMFAPASLSTRTELFRRVMTATDYINSNYMSPVTLDDIASAALLSKFHLSRLFRAFHGVSPAVYLRAKRIRTAERLIERSDADLAEIAERSGFGSRWSLFRALRQRRGMSGQRIRELWLRSTASTISTSV